MPKIKDISGEEFGYWTAIKNMGLVQNGDHKSSIWLCRCLCGTEREIMLPTLRDGKTHSCGCKRGIHRHTASGRRSKTYSSWSNAVARCSYPSNPAFEYYQRRGITMCDRWRNGEDGKGGFECFLEDMGEVPEGCTLDRFPNNNGNYEPGNCRWASKTEQANNRITNIIFNYKGKDFTLAELSRHTGVSKDTLRTRLVRSPHPWTVEEAVITPRLTKGKAKAMFCQ